MIVSEDGAGSQQEPEETQISRQAEEKGWGQDLWPSVTFNVDSLLV